ncbi:hypothetical protein Glove_680g75 [Diversispora epigaea]|uniref:Uncharacterized protein n=1 Tax=Diversispora epigaea TaxID=1348612 RepID=A0A397GBA7_9GLOM|nr:hypothetical protein Glove_680g75 [Diversispora epigaea]
MFNNMLKKSYSFGIVKYQEEFQDSTDQTRQSIFISGALGNCDSNGLVHLYVYGKDTERKYFYNFNPPDDERLRIRDLDGAVPLLSLGFMCTKGCNNPLYNPVGSTNSSYSSSVIHLAK